MECGKITKIVVYKLDRISRSLHDFSNLIELFRKYNVEFASTVETFDTSTAMGRAMLGIIMVFAELERENILLRVKDNYYARAEKGMFLGGPPIYGFDKIPTETCGVKTSVLVPNEKMEIVQYMYKAYSEGNTSLGDIVRELNAKGITSPNGTPWDSCKISRLLRSPPTLWQTWRFTATTRKGAVKSHLLLKNLQVNVVAFCTANAQEMNANTLM